jgi:hypothetical protein
MGVQDRDWYHEHSRKRDKSHVDDTDKAARRARYDPRQFRGGAQPPRASNRRRTRLFVAILILAVACAVAVQSFVSKGAVWRFANEVRAYAHSATGGRIGEAKSASDQKPSAQCDIKVAAPEPAVKQFIKDTDLFLRRLAEQRVKHELKELTGQTLQSEKERVERESQALLRFHERNLAKCFTNKESEAAVTKRFQAIKNSTKAFIGLK